MRRVAVFLLAAFLLSGCAVLQKQELKPAAKTLTHGRLVYLADRTCARTDRRVARHKQPKGYESFLTFLQHVVMPEYDRQLFELRALAPPPSDVVAYRRMLATFNEEDLVIDNFFQAADQLQLRRAKSLARRLDRLDKRLKGRAARVGLKTCAKG